MKPNSLRWIVLLFALEFASAPVLRGQHCPSLLINGDFESTGGFTSDYLFSTTLGPGMYAITNNAGQLSPHFAKIKGHTPGGNTYYMAMDGDDRKDKSFWKAKVHVRKGSTYAFSFWIANMHRAFTTPNPDTLYATQTTKIQFIIDEKSLIKVNTKADTLWRQYVQLYTASYSGLINIALRNNANPQPLGGNDFALDDIYFGDTCVVTGMDAALTNEEVVGVYPNPVKTGTLHFSKTARTYSLVSLDNIVVMTGTNAPSISTANLPKGIYFLHLEEKKYKIVIE